MKRFTKASFSLLLTLVIVFGISPMRGIAGIDQNFSDWFNLSSIFGFTASALSEGIYTYEVTGNFSYISKCDILTSGEIVLPSSLGGYEVIGIRDNAFNGCTHITSITIPESITKIGSAAFFGCSYLRSIKVDEYNTAYSSLEGVLYDKNKTVLLQCPERKSGEYIIPAGVKSISDKAFYNCKVITNIGIPDGVLSIGMSSFRYCVLLSAVTIPASVISVGEYAFADCSNLRTVNYNAVNCTVMGSYGNYVFANTYITSLIIGSSVKRIPAYAFRGLRGLADINLPNSIEIIEKYAFAGCTDLSGITIPENITNIGEGAFADCDLLWFVQLNATNCLTMGSYSKPVFSGSTFLDVVKIGSNVIRIPAFAFKDEYTISTIAIPDNVTSIGEYAFTTGSSMKIYCTLESFAHLYANDYGFAHVLIGLTPKGSTVVDKQNGYIYGLSEASNSLPDYLTAFGGASTLVTPFIENTLGTGTTVKLMYGNVTIKPYTLILFGDVNGDGNVDANDADTCVDVQNWMIIWNHDILACFHKAGDINGDGNVDAIDADIMTEVSNWRMNINQTTGIATVT